MAAVSPLHSDESRKLLDTIDQLRLLPSISHEITLPQIVVVGQQSSGKSSVLKAISNIDFPTNSGLCTQFATEIICRREKLPVTRVSIIPSSESDAQHRDALEAFSQRWSDVHPDQDLSRIIYDARQVMGLNDHQRITRDKLRLEFSGPHQDHISLIDLPGLFEQALHGQRLDDKIVVDDMVREYISGEQTIILAVVSGAYDLQVQRIFGMFEPFQDRTIGVITAPDLVEAGTARATTFQKLFRNASFKAGHEWHVLRNLSHREEQDGEDRDEVEKRFFAHRKGSPNDVWGACPEERLGIKNFKDKLANLLQTSIIGGLPQIQRQLRSAHHKCEEELLVLGDERSTPEQQRDYLAEKSESLRARTTTELNGGTSSLRSSIRNANNRFANDMASWGACRDLKNSAKSSTSPAPSSGSLPSHQQPISITRDDWLNMMFEEISNSRGRELDGFVDHVWIGRMFVRQSHKWRLIAEAHAEEVLSIVWQYFDEITETMVDSKTAARFLQYAIYPELERRQNALKAKISELLSPYASEHLRTLNPRWNQLLGGLNAGPVPGMDKKPSTMHTIFHYTCAMLEYYDLALAVSVDNVESLAVENVLLDGLEEIMTANMAHKMDEERLATLASEPQEVADLRRNLQARIEDYTTGSRIISHFSVRNQLKVHSTANRTSLSHSGFAFTRATPSVFVESVSDRASSVDGQSDAHSGSSSATSAETQTTERPTSRLSTSASSRSSSASRVFTDSENDGDGSASGSSSLQSTPLKGKSPRRNKFQSPA